MTYIIYNMHTVAYRVMPWRFRNIIVCIMSHYGM